MWLRDLAFTIKVRACHHRRHTGTLTWERGLVKGGYKKADALSNFLF
jgi:hypothetical protein